MIRTDNVEYHEGYRAFGRGERDTDCPYKPSSHRGEDSRFNRWQMGWSDAFASAQAWQGADQY
jgi:hypothetical protein